MTDIIDYSDEDLNAHSDFIAQNGYDEYVKTCTALNIPIALEQGDVAFETWISEHYLDVCKTYFEIALNDEERAEYLWQQYLARDLSEGE